MKICVIGTGYVGLVTGACLAEAGNDVVCVDVDAEKIGRLAKGICPIFEPGLEPLLAFNLKEGRLRFTTDLSAAINDSEIAFIAVGTPTNEDGSADVRHVLDAAKNIAKAAKKPIRLGTKSTVPVGTGDQIEDLFRETTSQPCIVFSNPEFLKEGDAINDFMKPDRIVVGLNDLSILPIIHNLYAPFTRQKDRLIMMSRRSAELTKYAANAMLATRISFMNEMANLCEKVGANIHDVRMGIGSDPRIGSAFLFPGMGYGGSCFPKDIKALMNTGRTFGHPLELMDVVDRVNCRQRDVWYEKISRHFGGPEKLKGIKVAVWGLAFKAKTDDIRESPALHLISRLLESSCQVSVFDPQAMENAKRVFNSQIHYASNNYEALREASGLVIATDWNEFRSPDYGRIKSLMKQGVIFDGRNLWRRQTLEEMGFVYYGIGV